MGDQQQQQPNLMAQVPPGPPLFWKQFTSDAIEQIEKLRAETSADYKVADKSSYVLPPRIPNLPAKLRFLQPPEPPATGTYRTFGQICTIEDELPELAQGVEQLYTPPGTPREDGKHDDRALILKRFAKSLLLNFLELVGVMGINPEQGQEKIADLHTLFANFHHLLNEYRPFQARESLILRMQDQLEKSRAETEGIMNMKEKVEGMLEAFGEIKLGDENIASSQVHEDVTEDEGKDVWEQLDLEFG